MDMSWIQYVGDFTVTGALVVLIVMVFRQQKRDSKPMQQIVDLVDKTVTRMSDQMQRWVDAQLDNSEAERAARAAEFRERSEMQLQTVQATMELTKQIMALKNSSDETRIAAKSSTAAINSLAKTVEKEHKTTRGVVVENHEKTQRVFRSYWGENAGGNKYA